MSVVMKKRKPEIIKQYKAHDKDTGSVSVQIAILTARINHLVEHLKTFKKDMHSRRGLLVLVGKRKRMLKYLYNNNLKKYQELIGQLGIKG